MTNEPSRETTSYSDQRHLYRHVKAASIRGARAGIAAMVSQAILRLGSIALLARLLSPEDFGIAAMAGILLNLVALIGDWGLTTASTQRLTLNHEELSTIFWINCLVGLILAAITALCSPLLAAIFEESRVIGATIVLSVTVVAIGLGAQHEALMRRQLKYDTLQLIRVASHAVGISVGVIVALLSHGFWALIAMQVGTQIARTALYWVVSDWRPGPPNIKANVSPVLRFATNLVPSTILFYVSRNVAPIVLGGMAGPSDLGLYNRASVCVMTPLSYLIEPIERVLPASLSRLQGDAIGFERLLAKALMVTAFLACGALALIAVEAPAVVALMLGEQWHSAAPLVRWLTLAGATWTVGKVIGWVLVPCGRSGRLLVVRAMRAVASVGGVVIGWRWGPVGIAAGYGIATLVSLVGETLYGVSGIPLKPRVMIGALWRPLVAAMVAAGVVLAIPTSQASVLVLLEVVLYGAVFLGVYALLPGGRHFMRDLRQAVTTGLASTVNR